MTKKFKLMSKCGKAHRQAIKELHLAEEVMKCAIARVHQTAADLADHHCVDPEEYNLLGGPGGNKGG